MNTTLFPFYSIYYIERIEKKKQNNTAIDVKKKNFRCLCVKNLLISVTQPGRCGSPELAPPPCGTSDICLGRHDGRYPATIRGCSFYFECQHGQFTSLRRCTADEGGYFFNPETGGCDYPQNICPPCGYRWWGW